MSTAAYKWWVVAMLWWVCFFNYADRQAIFSVFPLLKSELDLSDVQLGMAGASFMWMYALFGPVAGWLGDRLSRKGLILGALVFWSAVTAASALSHTFWQLTLCRALGGLGEAFYFPASMSLIGDYHTGATRSRAMAFHQSSVYAGTIGGGVCSGWIAQIYGWRPMFVWFGVLGAALGVVLIGLLREPVRGVAEQKPLRAVPAPPLGQLLRQILGVRVVVLLIAAFIGANFVAMVFLTWMPSYLHRTFGMNLSMAGFNATAYLQTASVLGVLSGGILADSLSRRRRGSPEFAGMAGRRFRSGSRRSRLPAIRHERLPQRHIGHLSCLCHLTRPSLSLEARLGYARNCQDRLISDTHGLKRPEALGARLV